jgi:hypothetical protein
VPIVASGRATYNWQRRPKRDLSTELADMDDDDSKWMSLAAAAAHVETTQQCYREKAIDLIRQAADNLKLRSRTTPPSWIESTTAAGDEIAYYGTTVEFYRKHVLELWPEGQKDATRSSPRKSGSALQNGIRSAIADIGPDRINTMRTKDLYDKIHERLIAQGIITKFEDVSRTIQRVLKADREAHS